MKTYFQNLLIIAGIYCILGYILSFILSFGPMPEAVKTTVDSADAVPQELSFHALQIVLGLFYCSFIIPSIALFF